LEAKNIPRLFLSPIALNVLKKKKLISGKFKINVDIKIFFLNEE